MKADHCSHTFRDSNTCTKCGQPVPLFHAVCGVPLVWRRLPRPVVGGVLEPSNQFTPDPGLALYCGGCARFVERAEWSNPEAKPVTLA